jgi:hypothetical protein
MNILPLANTFTLCGMAGDDNPIVHKVQVAYPHLFIDPQI